MNDDVGVCPVCGWEDHFNTLVHHVTASHTPDEWLGLFSASLLNEDMADIFAEDREELTA